MSTPPKLTDEQILDAFCTTPNINQFVSAFTAGARFTEAARDDQWIEHIKSNGWRQCAEGQGVSQFCPQAEEMEKKLQALEAQRDELLSAHEACKAANTILIQDCAATCKAQASEPAPKREWVGLSDADRQAAFESMPEMLEGFLKTWGWLHFCKAIESKLKELNHD